MRSKRTEWDWKPRWRPSLFSSARMVQERWAWRKAWGGIYERVLRRLTMWSKYSPPPLGLSQCAEQLVLKTQVSISAVSIQHILTLTTDRDFIRSLEECNSFLQWTLFQVLVQDSLDHSTRNSSNFRLKSLKDDFRKTMSNNLSPTEEEFL